MWGTLKKLRHDNDGATLVYVSITVTVLFAFIALALDFSRFNITDTQAQAAADAAAIAAASQLDGGADSIARATNAAINTPLVSNRHQFSEDSDGDGNVRIASIRFLDSLPANDDDPITSGFETTVPRDAEFVEVTTEVLTHTNLFLPVIGSDRTATLTATAVAGQESAICRVTPLAICNPNEDVFGAGAAFGVDDWVGRQLVVKMAGNGSQWAPGNFGLLDTPNGGQSAPALADQLAAVDGANECFSTRLNTRPGQVSSLRSALNTRFDIYENPFFANDEDDPRYAPSPNVTKGRIWTGPGSGNTGGGSGGNGNGNGGGGGGGNPCNSFVEPGAPDTTGLPRDNAFLTPAGGSGGRFGNGRWNCLDYWNINHPLTPVPSDFSCLNNSDAVSRYDVYRWEIDNNRIPGAITGSQEEGAPICYRGDPGAITTDPDLDRRVLNFSVINCTEHNVRGNESNVPGEAFLRAFLTESVGDATTPGSNDFDVYLEVIEVVEPGVADGTLKEFVEIYR